MHKYHNLPQICQNPGVFFAANSASKVFRISIFVANFVKSIHKKSSDMNNYTASENIAMMQKAKSQLANKWGDAAIASIIYLLIMGVASSTYAIELILSGPLTLGFIVYLTMLATSSRPEFSVLFSGFNRFVETLIAGLLYSVIISVATILLIVPGIIAACGLSMTFFIMSEDTNISGVDALKASWNMMQGYKWTFFCLTLRFLGWIINWTVEKLEQRFADEEAQTSAFCGQRSARNEK